VAPGEVVDDLACVWQGPGQTVELRHDEGVSLAARSQRGRQSGAVPVRAGESMVDVDAFSGDSETVEGVALRREVLGVGGHAGIADKQLSHNLLLGDGDGGRHQKAGSSGWRRTRAGVYGGRSG
jgi:hypothetical protein